MSQSALAQKAAVVTPASGVWTIDTAHTTVGVVARHLMIARVRGTFSNVTGTVIVAERPEDSSVEVSIPAATIDTGNESRDQHLRSPDFLDAETYPALTFRSTHLEPKGGSAFRMHGNLTIRGVTRPVVLDVTFDGLATDPWGNEHAAFTATGTIDREEWGMTWNQALETGGMLVGKRLAVEIDVQLVKQL